MHEEIIENNGFGHHKCQHCGTMFGQSSDLQIHLVLPTFEGNVSDSYDVQQYDNNDGAMIEVIHSNVSLRSEQTPNRTYT